MSYDDCLEDIEFPTAICPIVDPHEKHRIPGTWRQECPGIVAEVAQRQFCLTGIHDCLPAVTLTFTDDMGQRRFHWCAEHAANAELYRAGSDQAEVSA